MPPLYQREDSKMKKPKVEKATIKIAGQDRKGIIATMTNFLFENQLNIEDIDQRILDNYLIMNMRVDLTALKESYNSFSKELKKVAKTVGCDAEFNPLLKKQTKNVALLVTREDHCLIDLLENFKKKKLKGLPSVIIGNHPDLKPIAKKYNIPFHHIPSEKKKVHESKMIKILQNHDIDLIVLARYMQIMSPEFCFRYEGKIINIHPSLLPAFPGPRSYHQAFNKGVEIVGVTAHFVTTDLDEGPIIAQDCFKVDRTCDTVEKYIDKGQKLEAKVLTKAVKMFLEDRLVLRRGKVLDNKALCQTAKQTKAFYKN